MAPRDVVSRSAVTPSAAVTALPRQGPVGRGDAAPAAGPAAQDAPAAAVAGDVVVTLDGRGDGRGTPLQALAGWGGALVAGGACWAGVLWVVGRLL